MLKSFKLPDLGEGIHEGEILSISVSKGDTVKEGDTIFEIETDKASVEIPSPYTGIIKEIMVMPGDVVKVGSVIMTFEVSQDIENLEKISVLEPVSNLERKPSPIPASPATRRLARKLGVDLQKVIPTGRGEIVTSDDVHKFANQKKSETISKSEKKTSLDTKDKDSASLPDFSKWGAIEHKPVRSIRRATAKHMTTAWSQIPHVSMQDMADITQLEIFRQKHKKSIESKGGKLTLTVFALKAVVTALKKLPNFNSSLDHEADSLIIKHYYHIGIAVDTKSGLIVPVIHDVDRKSITELSIELTDLIKQTHDRKLGHEKLQGGTFSITNMGQRGGLTFNPIINYPQVAIMGMGKAKLQPIARHSSSGKPEIVPRLMLPVILAMDHRVLDGADGGKFINIIIQSLEDPEELMLTMA